MANLSDLTTRGNHRNIPPLRRARAEALASYLSVQVGGYIELDDEFYKKNRSRFAWSIGVIDRAIEDATFLNRLVLRPWADGGDAGINIVLLQPTDTGAKPCQA